MERPPTPLTPAQAADRAGVDEADVRRLISLGILPEQGFGPGDVRNSAGST
jgi:hypothetical protein